jgi:hypothetical protein
LIRSGGEVTRLIDQLRDTDPIRRDTAVARLRVIGTRAVDGLVALALDRRSTDASCAALKALEGIDDRRGIDAALPLLDHADPRIAGAALAVLRQWITREEGTRVLDALTAAALNPTLDGAVRLAALDAVAQLPRHIVAPVIEAAGAPAVQSSNGDRGGSDSRMLPQVDGLAEDDPLSVLEWIAANRTSPLSQIHGVIVRVRERELQERSPARRDQWTRARGAAHAALSARGSTVAVYDLRETFETAGRALPTDFATAVAAVGDMSCLEPLARAWTAAAGETWWRARLREAASDIVRREKLTGRNAAIKRIRSRWPGFL